MADITPVLERADANLPASLNRLFDLVRIKSISTDLAFKAECRKAAEWLVAELETLGFEASLRDTPGHPMVVAHHTAEKADAPHLLFYGHYDVQPVDPLNLWEAPPFEPSIKEIEPGRKVITGRGSSACSAWNRCSSASAFPTTASTRRMRSTNWRPSTRASALGYASSTQ